MGHIGGDDFVAVGRGDDFLDSVRRVVRIFNGRAGGFYSGRDHAAGGIEALDRTGEFRFFPVMDLTVSVVDGEGCGSVDDLACRAGLEKKRLKGEIVPDTVAGFLGGGAGPPGYDDFRRWIEADHPDTVQIKALLETAGILGDTGMTGCLTEILERDRDYRIRKSAARALGSIAGRDSADTLHGAMKDGNVHVRTASTLALPFVMGKEAGPLLKDAVNDPSTWVRRAALRGLGISGWPGAAEILARELKRPNDGRYWLNHRQELAAALEGASFLGDPRLSGAVLHVLRNNPGVKKSAVWKTLLTLGGARCLEEMNRAFRSGDHHECIENLSSFDPGGLSQDESGELESLLASLELRRRGDRIQVLRLLARIRYEPEGGTADWLLDMTASTDDAAEFETLLETLQARKIPPRSYDLARVVDRLSGEKLKLGRRAVVSMLRWASMGRYPVSRTYLDELLRHDSREVRTAAARAVISLARKNRK
ncbi:MAG: HEAT repeat domain-containing protein [Candidatus Fermentibacteraceae bacterium]|nr:HEAT repeat domain-containing protein [Candidatus Fermentibacteraceae bacterium]